MRKKLSYLLYLASIAFLPWLVSFSFHKSLELLITHWWNTHQSETLLNSILEKHVLERFIESEELFLLDKMIKEYPKTYIQKLPLGIHKETIQLVKTHNKYFLDIFLNFLTNLISFTILSSYLILSKDKLLILNSWSQEFLYNLSDTKKALLMIFFIDLTLGYHSTDIWEMLMDSLCYLGLFNKGFLSIIFSIIPVILHSIFSYWVFNYLTRVSPSLVVIYDLIKKQI